MSPIWVLALCCALIPTAIASHGFRYELDGKIVGGSPISITQAPYQVSVRRITTHICGGAIISESFIITAAHCTDGRVAGEMTIYAGSTDRSKNGQLGFIKTIHQHPEYDPAHVNNDISILHLMLPLKLAPRSSAKAVSLPEALQEPPPNTDAFVSGWGRLRPDAATSTSLLQGVTVQIVERELCRQSYTQNPITDNMICAAGGGERDSCQGDSGGPMVIDGKLVGIVSWGIGCADPKYPGVYTNVAAFRDFIKEITQL